MAQDSLCCEGLEPASSAQRVLMGQQLEERVYVSSGGDIKYLSCEVRVGLALESLSARGSWPVPRIMCSPYSIGVSWKADWRRR
jgi:hypothetical protein